jgi:hypothetical protein
MARTTAGSVTSLVRSWLSTIAARMSAAVISLNLVAITQSIPERLKRCGAASSRSGAVLQC